ncbi:MAG: hypothetical protein NUV98_07210 [Candidatus Roizmanbacteria bacterium]|nr:hypothetical protein [Candidatus Roizmanbacteria bacterium]
MSTRLVIFIIGGLIFGGILAGLLYYANARQKTTDSANQQELTELPTPSPSPAELVIYQHESGFSFQHPEDSTVTENELDDAAYADLTLTSERESGSIEIDIVDTKLKDLTAWKKQNKVASDSMKTAEAELADLPAFEEQLNSGRKTLTAIEQGTLYTIVVDPGENFEYWDEVYQLLVSSFAFELPAEEETDPAPASSGGGSTGGDIIFEGEEIIE